MSISTTHTLTLGRQLLLLAFASTLLSTNSVMAESSTEVGNEIGNQVGIQPSIIINISAQPLADAITALSKQSGMQIYSDGKLLAGKSAPATSGRMSAEQALNKLLQGTGLTAQRLNGGLAIVSAASSSAIPTATHIQEAKLDEVIVSGEKIQRKWSETLSSVAVTTAEDMKEHADYSLMDTLARTPGVNIQSRNETWGIRGVPVSGFDDQGPRTLNNAVSVFVDGALQTNRFITMSPLSLWDMKQIEVFRGSQSTVQGRNALAGAVIMQSNDPVFKNEMAVQTQIGNYGQRGAAVMANAEIVPGQLAGRFTVSAENEDGYIRNPFLDKDADARRSVNLRGKLLLVATEQTDAMLTLAHTNYRTGSNGVTRNNQRPLYYQLIQNTDAGDRIQQNEATLKLNHYLTPNWTLTSITSGTHSEYHALLDFDQNATTNQRANMDYRTRLFNQELRAVYSAETLQAHVGAYYSDSQVKFEDALRSGNTLALNAEGENKIRNRAVFGEVNWAFIPQWKLIAGLRYDSEKNNTNVTYLRDILGFSPVSAANESKSFGALLPKLGVSYQVTPQQLLGFVVQRGYRGGGTNTRVPSDHRPYDAEYTTNYELSYRGQWQQLRLMANAYYTDWKDQQVRMLDTATDTVFVSNAARSRMQGLELSSDYDVNKQLRLFAGASYNHTRYEDYITADGDDLSGKSFVMAPKYKINMGLTYRPIAPLFFTVDAIYQDESQAIYQRGGIPQYNDSVKLLNASVGYQLNQRLRFTGFVRNLFDREYTTNNNGTVLDVGAPRTFGVSVRLDI